ncbi:hypothetical protein SSPIM334S_06298 [Streptomyces spiroverticillatus]|nr:hypothetical protein [Streptomyces finlayi]
MGQSQSWVDWMAFHPFTRACTLVQAGQRTAPFWEFEPQPI